MSNNSEQDFYDPLDGDKRDNEPRKDIYSDPDIQIEFIDVMIVVDRPSKEDLADYNRSEKYKILRENHTRHRQKIVVWLEDNGYQEAIKIIDQPTAFNLLFAHLPIDLMSSLRDAPGVIEVAQIDDFDVDPLSKSKLKKGKASINSKHLQSRTNRIY